MSIGQDVILSYRELVGQNDFKRELDPRRHYWVQMAGGQMTVNGIELNKSDGLGLYDVSQVEIKSHSDAKFLFFEMP